MTPHVILHPDLLHLLSSVADSFLCCDCQDQLEIVAYAVLVREQYPTACLNERPQVRILGTDAHRDIPYSGEPLWDRTEAKAQVGEYELKQGS